MRWSKHKAGTLSNNHLSWPQGALCKNGAENEQLEVLLGGGLLDRQADHSVSRCLLYGTDCVSTFPAGLESKLTSQHACQSFTESSSLCQRGALQHRGARRGGWTPGLTALGIVSRAKAEGSEWDSDPEQQRLHVWRASCVVQGQGFLVGLKNDVHSWSLKKKKKKRL